MTELEFLKKWRELFNSETGKDCLAYLESVYVQPSCLHATTEGTFYKLGQKELIQGLVEDARSTEQSLERFNQLYNEE